MTDCDVEMYDATVENYRWYVSKYPWMIPVLSACIKVIRTKCSNVGGVESCDADDIAGFQTVTRLIATSSANNRDEMHRRHRAMVGNINNAMIAMQARRAAVKHYPSKMPEDAQVKL
ncbi:hypothetical protein DM01DRAFT_324485 [Hesseltinella vesiculosa]|uniref:Uncharacterized protein n=1 Tax=Hesseltinella vesiculosa TaxID=101127 RepID=A0A1X2GBW6_9FUNG|nr:hypothetical protein DM01DRAFT_324485 [Hesseltinella vesiculosa]